ncbi:hypothetical protein EON77_04655, partial [bacterium]
MTKPPPLAKTALTHMALVALAILFVLPLLWMLSTALKPIGETMTTPPRWVPSKVLWSNFPDAIRYNSKELGYVPF